MATESSSLRPHVLGDASLEGLAAYILRHNVTKLLVLLGAGVSVAAGIPDFRTPNTGIYANLQKYDLEDPTEAFSLSLLRERPEVFYAIARDMDLWPGRYRPTAVHHFVKLLADEGRLLRCCTQNIDGLERAAGVPESLLVEAHGSFSTASCIDCDAPCCIDRVRRQARENIIPRCDVCHGVIKPDVVFFGEPLPERFFDVMMNDTAEAEMVIIIGTSLQVHPFAVLPLRVALSVPRVVINMERVGGGAFSFPQDVCLLPKVITTPSMSTTAEERPETASSKDAPSSSSSTSDGYAQYGDYAHHPQVCRDLFIQGDSQTNVQSLARFMGLDKRLLALMD